MKEKNRPVLSELEMYIKGVIFDIETTGLGVETGIYEASVYSLNENRLAHYYLRPELAVRQEDFLDESGGFRSTSRVRFEHETFSTWRELIDRQLELATGEKPSTEAARRRTLRDVDDFLYDKFYVEKVPVLTKDKLTAVDIAEEFKYPGRSFDVSSIEQDVSFQDLVRKGSQFTEGLKGRVTWIANANFESKIFGAHINATGSGDGIRRNLESRNPDEINPFYVTGVEVNKARAKAKRTGDWTVVWKAYLDHSAPKKDEIIVRDIQDVTRAVLSYGSKLGIYSGSDSYFGAGIDLSQRLIASSILEARGDKKEAAKELMKREFHRSFRDTAESESLVLKEMFKMASILQEFDETRNPELIDKPEFTLARKFFQKLSLFRKESADQNRIIQRLARAQRDIIQQGYTIQVVGVGSTKYVDHLTYAGNTEKVPIVVDSTKIYNRLDDVFEYLLNSRRYSIPESSERLLRIKVEELNRELLDKADSKKSALSTVAKWERSLYGADTYEEASELWFSKNKERLVNLDIDDVELFGARASSLTKSSINNIINDLKKPSNAKVIAGAALGAYAISTTIALSSEAFDGRRDDLPLTLGIGTYKDYESHFDGLAKQGISSETRKYNTDFGSPYRGSATSEQVVQDQDLVRARQDWILSQAGIRGHQPVSPAEHLRRWSSSVSYNSRNRDYFDGGEWAEFRGEAGLKGRLKIFDLQKSSWDIKVEDADTVTLLKKGSRDSYSFRLEGIDSPETAHQGRKAQPFAYEARESLKRMVSSANKIQIAYDPYEATYGRLIGSVIADGQNVAYKLVEEGSAAALPFKSAADTAVDIRRLLNIEREAYENKRGMWSDPYFQTFYEFSKNSSRRVTLNTIVNDRKVAQNHELMDVVSLMKSGERGEGVDKLAQNIGRNYTSWSDSLRPGFFEHRAQHSSSVYIRQSSAAAKLNKNRGDTINKHRELKRRGNSSALVDNTGFDMYHNSTSVHSRRAYHAFEDYGLRKNTNRRKSMAELQRAALKDMNSNPIDHTSY